MHLLAVVDRLRAAGANLELGRDTIRNVPIQKRLRAVDVTTMAYPGFPTDLQAQFMALMTRADGVSVITEKIYPERFIHAAELQRLGAKIRREGATAIIEGTEELRGAPVMASDLRASASLVLAGLVARGATDVRRVYHIDRGYEKIEEKLQCIGADIERISDG
jgi:UDP-N-acetylglucosamine 1-carboxyvinyltransferase